MDYAPLKAKWQADEALAPWADILDTQLSAGLSHQRYGDLQRWLESLADLPDIPVSQCHLDGSRVGVDAALAPSPTEMERLETALRGLHPWRKGPFELFGLHIDTEWRSDFKWDRLAPHIEDLRGRRVLDVGCGSGYHCWRMAGAGASEVIGIDPTPLFIVQFWALQKYLQQPHVWVLPARMEEVPPKLHAFDTVFSMGVLYHRRSPMDHLQELRDALRPGGQLVLETLVVEGDEGKVLVPEGRYARMGNVWFLPSSATLLTWLRKMGFRNPVVVDECDTTAEEQRSTDWMQFHSLSNFLDPENQHRTLEGHPAPRRAVLCAHAPG